VADERVPLGLVEGHSRAARLHLEHFLDDELVPVVASDAAPELRRLHRAADLQHVPIVWRESGSGSRAVVERALKRQLGRRRPHERDVQLGSTEAIKAAVLLGLGVGFLSRWSIQAETRSGRFTILELRDLRVQRSFSWALRAANVSGQAGRFYRHACHAPPVLG
jgi:DNA-binding transcriptional LysR family regulator